MEKVEAKLDNGSGAKDLNDSSSKLREDLDVPVVDKTPGGTGLPDQGFLPDIQCTLTKDENRIDFECEMKGRKFDIDGFLELVGGAEHITHPDLKQDQNHKHLD